MGDTTATDGKKRAGNLAAPYKTRDATTTDGKKRAGNLVAHETPGEKNRLGRIDPSEPSSCSAG
jgi:hypothetical protein